MSVEVILVIAAGMSAVAAILENDARYAGVGVLLLAVSTVL
jgi:hypothetical protein